MKNKLLKIVIGVAIILCSYGFILYKILDFSDWVKTPFSTYHFALSDWLLFLIVIALMIVNWSVETLKWKILIDKIQSFTFINALKAVFAGISIGIVTPNRIGEVGGRALFLDKGKRTYGVFATAIGSFAQFITSITNGVLAFILFIFLFPDKIHISSVFNTLSAIISFSALVVLIWCYFHVQKIKPFLIQFAFFKKRINQLEFLSNVKQMSLLAIILFSIVRYVVFFIQFFILLKIFNVQLNIIQGYSSIGLIYLFSTIIPTTTLAELGIRGSLAIFFIGIFSENTVGIVSSTFILWFINLVIPSVIGSVIFIKKQSLNKK